MFLGGECGFSYKSLWNHYVPGAFVLIMGPEKIPPRHIMF
jgi:hypothetical protein